MTEREEQSIQYKNVCTNTVQDQPREGHVITLRREWRKRHQSEDPLILQE